MGNKTETRARGAILPVLGLLIGMTLVAAIAVGGLTPASADEPDTLDLVLVRLDALEGTIGARLAEAQERIVALESEIQHQAQETAAGLTSLDTILAEVGDDISNLQSATPPPVGSSGSTQTFCISLVGLEGSFAPEFTAMEIAFDIKAELHPNFYGIGAGAEVEGELDTELNLAVQYSMGLQTERCWDLDPAFGFSTAEKIRRLANMSPIPEERQLLEDAANLMSQLGGSTNDVRGFLTVMKDRGDDGFALPTVADLQEPQAFANSLKDIIDVLPMPTKVKQDLMTAGDAVPDLSQVRSTVCNNIQGGGKFAGNLMTICGAPMTDALAFKGKLIQAMSRIGTIKGKVDAISNKVDNLLRRR